MRVIKNIKTIVKMMEKTGYEVLVEIDKVEPDEQLDVVINCCTFFDEKREKIQKIYDLTLDEIMYSWFYWGEVCIATLGMKGRDNYGDCEGVVDYLLRIPELIEDSGLGEPDVEFMETLSDEVNKWTKGGLDAYYNRRDN